MKYFLYKLYIQYKILGIKKYRIKELFIKDNSLTLSLIKIKDLGYENDVQLTPREMTEVRDILISYFPPILIDYVSKSFRSEIL
jgi:hypothetical protein